MVKIHATAFEPMNDYPPTEVPETSTFDPMAELEGLTLSEEELRDIDNQLGLQPEEAPNVLPEGLGDLIKRNRKVHEETLNYYEGLVRGVQTSIAVAESEFNASVALAQSEFNDLKVKLLRDLFNVTTSANALRAALDVFIKAEL